MWQNGTPCVASAGKCKPAVPAYNIGLSEAVTHITFVTLAV